MKAKSAAEPKIKTISTRKPEGRPKVKLGTGTKVLWTSDTLFDDDLKR